MRLRRALAEEPDLFDERNFGSLILAGAPDDDEVADALLPCDVEPRRAPLKPWIPVAIREAVLQRDNWTCGLCHRAIDRAVRWPHPLSASVDHITPRADGGLHAHRNLRAAHLACNQRRARSREASA